MLLERLVCLLSTNLLQEEPFTLDGRGRSGITIADGMQVGLGVRSISFGICIKEFVNA